MSAHASLLSPAEYRHILRADLVSFFQAAFYELNPQTVYVPGAHIEVLASKLEACRRGEIRRLIINLPPRSLKSHCVSIAFPAWLLGHDPAAHIICASYGQDLAVKLAHDTRTLMYSAWYQTLFATRLSERQAVHDFTTNRMGGRMATSVGGVLTGRGAEFIILDDPLKPEEALSETQRQAVNDWFDNTLLSRLNDKTKGCIIIVMQRLHQDDLVGHVLEQGDWHIVSFPAIAQEDETHIIQSPFGTRFFRRRAGDALDPKREPLKSLEQTRHDIGEYNFLGQYQQNPAPAGGAMIKTEWLRFYEPGSEPGRFNWIMQSWDTANKAGELNDYSVCTTWGIIDQEFYLLDVFRKKLNYPELKRTVIDLKRRFGAYLVVIEDKASGTPLIQELRREGHLIRPYLPLSGTDKQMRLHIQTPHFESGRVRLRRGAPWLNDYVAELTTFPGSKYDDQVDSTTQFLDYFGQSGSRPLLITEEAVRRSARRGRIPAFF